MPRLLLLLAFGAALCGQQVTGQPVRHDPASLIEPLIDPAKLATLGDRAANPRVQKITAILWQAKLDGHDVGEVADRAVALIGWEGTDKGRMTAAAMVRNVTIMERLGSTLPEDLEQMRRGRAPTVRRGPYAGEVLSVNQIIPDPLNQSWTLGMWLSVSTPASPRVLAFTGLTIPQMQQHLRPLTRFRHIPEILPYTCLPKNTLTVGTPSLILSQSGTLNSTFQGPSDRFHIARNP